MMSRSSCTCGKCSFHPENNLTLVALRQSWPNRDWQDRPDPNEQTIGVEMMKLRGEVGEDGMVRFFPVED